MFGIQRYEKNQFISRTKGSLNFNWLSDATFYDYINTIYQFSKPFGDKKCLFLRNMFV